MFDKPFIKLFFQEVLNGIEVDKNHCRWKMVSLYSFDYAKLRMMSSMSNLLTTSGMIPS